MIRNESIMADFDQKLSKAAISIRFRRKMTVDFDQKWKMVTDFYEILP